MTAAATPTFDLSRDTPISRALFRYRAADRRLVARTGHALTFARTSIGTARAGEGRLFRPVHSAPRYHSALGPTAGVFDQVGLLLEPARDNLLLRSQEIDHASWTKTNLTITANAVRAPDGTLTADKLAETTTNATHKVAQAVSIAAGRYWTLSAFFRAAERDRLQLNVFNGADAVGATFNVTSLAMTNVLAGAGSLTDKGLEEWTTVDGERWVRVWISGRVSAGATSLTAEVFLLNAAGASSYAGTTGSGGYLWGVQFEDTNTTGATVSSYIPTTSATVTRAAETLSAVANWAFQDLAIYFKVQRPLWAAAAGNLDRAPAILTLGNGTPRFALYFDQAGRNLVALLDPGAAATSQNIAIPAGNVIEGVVELKDLLTAGKLRFDVGGGWQAYSGTTGPCTGWSTTDLTLGGLKYAAGNILGTGLLDLTIVPAGRTLAQLQGVY